MLAAVLILAGKHAPRRRSDATPGKTRDMSTRPPKKRNALRTVIRITVAFVLGAGLGVSVHVAPFVARDMVVERLRDAARQRGFELQIGAAFLDPLHELTLDDLVLHDRLRRHLPPLARVERLRARYDVNGIRNPRVFIKDISIDGVRIQLERTGEGRTNLDGALEWLATRGADAGGPKGAGGGNKWRRYLSDHLPDLKMNRIQVSIDDHQGGPLLTAGGLDLRHIRLHNAAVEIVDESPVRETAQLRLRGRTRIAGLAQELEVNGELSWPAREGWLKMAVPDSLQLEMAGFRAGIEQVAIYSDGRVIVGGLRAERLLRPGSTPLALQVREVEVRLGERAAKGVLPDALRKRLPAPLLAVLRHVEEVAVHEPVLAGRRPVHAEDSADDSDAADNGEMKPFSRRRLRRLLPRASRRLDAAAVESGKKKKPQHRRGKGRDVEPETRDGSKVRNALAQLLSGAADRLEADLGSLRRLVAGIPVRLVLVHHGRARYRDERLEGAASGEVSDFNARIERSAKDGMVAIALDFEVPGRKVDNRISGRVDPTTGDTQLRLHLDRLPLAPYAALAPAALTIHGDSAIHDTRAVLRYDAAARRIGLDGKAAISRIDVAAPRISRHQIGDLSAAISGKLQLDLERQRLSFDEGELTLGKVRIRADGAISKYRTAPAFDLHVKVPTVDCQDTVDALVPPFAPMLTRMRCTGTLSFRVELSLDTADMDSLKFEFDPILRNVKIHSLGRYIDFNVLNMPFEHHARQEDQTLYSFVIGPGSDRWVDLEEISEYLSKVVFTTEDGTFHVHNGFSLNQIRRAMVANLGRGRFVRGASTMSQQLVKNLFFVEREKTLSRKIQEAVITWEIERTLEKEQLLALYFNIIEFGPHIYGIRAAANHFFNREPKDLTLLQCLWLGSIIPWPRHWYHHFTEGKVSDGRRRHLCWIADIMVKREKITAAERARLGDCNVVFGGGNDGSEAPAQGLPAVGLGHEEAWQGGPDAAPGLPAPGVDPTSPKLDAPGVDAEDQP